MNTVKIIFKDKKIKDVIVKDTIKIENDGSVLVVFDKNNEAYVAMLYEVDKYIETLNGISTEYKIG
jgi:hypothetical protein